MRVVIVGAECTGKTTLARGLAEHFDAPWSGEYARRFVERVGRPVALDDVSAIGRGQMELEDALDQAAPLAILDTDLLSTVVFSHFYFGDCPAWIEPEWHRRQGDLYLLAAPDLAWEPDAEQRGVVDRREECHARFKDALVRHGLPFGPVKGNGVARLEAAIRAVESHRGD